MRITAGEPQVVLALGRAPRGRVMWVNNASVAGHESLAGGGDGSYHSPYTSLVTAYDNAVASRDDCIMIGEGHSQAVVAAAGLTFAKAGLSVVGVPCDDRSRKPTISFTTATTADANVTASTQFYDLRFNCGIDSLAAPLDVDAADVGFHDCIFDETTTTLRCLEWVSAGSASHGLTFKRCKVIGAGATVTVASKNYFASIITSLGVEIEDCRFYGSYNTAVLGFLTGVCSVQALRSIFGNTKGNTTCVNDGNQAHTGQWTDCGFYCSETTGEVILANIVDHSAAKWSFMRCVCVNVATEASTASGPGSAVSA